MISNLAGSCYIIVIGVIDTGGYVRSYLVPPGWYFKLSMPHELRQCIVHVPDSSSTLQCYPLAEEATESWGTTENFSIAKKLNSYGEP